MLSDIKINDLIIKRQNIISKLNILINAVKIIIKEENLDELNRIILEKDNFINEYLQITNTINENLNNMDENLLNNLTSQENMWNDYLINFKNAIKNVHDHLNILQQKVKQNTLNDKFKSVYGN